MAVERLRKFGTMLDQADDPVPRGPRRRPHAGPDQHRPVAQPDRRLPLLTDRRATCSSPCAGPTTGTARRRGGTSCATRCATSCVRRSSATARCWPTSCSRRPGPTTSAGSAGSPTAPRSTRRSSGSTPGSTLSAEEIHAIGMEEVTEKLPAEYADVGGRLFGLSDRGRDLPRLLDDPDLRYANGDEILADARRCLDTATAAMPDWFGIRPRGAVRAHAGARLPGRRRARRRTTRRPRRTAAGPVSTTSTCTSPVRRAASRRRRSRSTRRSPAITCSWPSRPSGPTCRRSSACRSARPSFVEGWALYTERLAEEMGLYASDLDRVGMLASDSWRACRLVVDTGLHAMGWSRERAIDFMAEHAPVSRDEIIVEVDRYIGMPGQALAYKVGQREILRLAGRGPSAARRPVRDPRLPRHRPRLRHRQPPGAPPARGRLGGRRGGVIVGLTCNRR